MTQGRALLLEILALVSIATASGKADEDDVITNLNALSETHSSIPSSSGTETTNHDDFDPESCYEKLKALPGFTNQFTIDPSYDRFSSWSEKSTRSAGVHSLPPSPRWMKTTWASCGDSDIVSRDASVEAVDISVFREVTVADTSEADFLLVGVDETNSKMGFKGLRPLTPPVVPPSLPRLSAVHKTGITKVELSGAPSTYTANQQSIGHDDVIEVEEHHIDFQATPRENQNSQFATKVAGFANAETLVSGQTTNVDGPSDKGTTDPSIQSQNAGVHVAVDKALVAQTQQIVDHSEVFAKRESDFKATSPTQFASTGRGALNDAVDADQEPPSSLKKMQKDLNPPDATIAADTVINLGETNEVGLVESSSFSIEQPPSGNIADQRPDFYGAATTFHDQFTTSFVDLNGAVPGTSGEALAFENTNEIIVNIDTGALQSPAIMEGLSAFVIDRQPFGDVADNEHSADHFAATAQIGLEITSATILDDDVATAVDDPKRLCDRTFACDNPIAVVTTDQPVDEIDTGALRFLTGYDELITYDMQQQPAEKIAKKNPPVSTTFRYITTAVGNSDGAVPGPPDRVVESDIRINVVKTDKISLEINPDALKTLVYLEESSALVIDRQPDGVRSDIELPADNGAATAQSGLTACSPSIPGDHISIDIDDSGSSDKTVASDMSINVATTDQPMGKLEFDDLKSSVDLDESSALVINLQFDGDMADKELSADDAAVSTRCDVIANSATLGINPDGLKTPACLQESSASVIDRQPDGLMSDIELPADNVGATAQSGLTTFSPSIPGDHISIDIDNSDRVSDKTVASDMSINVATTDQPMVKLEFDALKSSVDLDESSASVINLQFDGDMAGKELSADDAAVSTRCDVIANSATLEINPDALNSHACLQESSASVIDRQPDGLMSDIEHPADNVAATAQSGVITFSPSIPGDHISIEIDDSDRVSDKAVASDMSINVATTDQPMVKPEFDASKSSVDLDESSELVINLQFGGDMADKELSADDAAVSTRCDVIANSATLEINPDALKTPASLEESRALVIDRQPDGLMSDIELPADNAAVTTCCDVIANSATLEMNPDALKTPVCPEKSSALVIDRQPDGLMSDVELPADNVGATAENGITTCSPSIPCGLISIDINDSDRVSDKTVASDMSINVATTDQPMVKHDFDALKSSVDLDESSALIINLQFGGDMADKELSADDAAVSTRCDVFANSATLEINPDALKTPACLEQSRALIIDRQPDGLMSDIELPADNAAVTTRCDVIANSATLEMNPDALKTPVCPEKSSALVIDRQPDGLMSDVELPAENVGATAQSGITTCSPSIPCGLISIDINDSDRVSDKAVASDMSINVATSDQPMVKHEFDASKSSVDLDESSALVINLQFDGDMADKELPADVAAVSTRCDVIVNSATLEINPDVWKTPVCPEKSSALVIDRQPDGLMSDVEPPADNVGATAQSGFTTCSPSIPCDPISIDIDDSDRVSDKTVASDMSINVATTDQPMVKHEFDASKSSVDLDESSALIINLQFGGDMADKELSADDAAVSTRCDVFANSATLEINPDALKTPACLEQSRALIIDRQPDGLMSDIELPADNAAVTTRCDVIANSATLEMNPDALKTPVCPEKSSALVIDRQPDGLMSDVELPAENVGATAQSGITTCSPSIPCGLISIDINDSDRVSDKAVASDMSINVATSDQPMVKHEFDASKSSVDLDESSALVINLQFDGDMADKELPADVAAVSTRCDVIVNSATLEINPDVWKTPVCPEKSSALVIDRQPDGLMSDVEPPADNVGATAQSGFTTCSPSIPCDPISIDIDDSDRVSDKTVASDMSINVATTDQPMVKHEFDASKSSVDLDESSALVINLQFDGDMADKELPADDAAVSTRCDAIANSATLEINPDAWKTPLCPENSSALVIDRQPDGLMSDVELPPDNVGATAQSGFTTCSPSIPCDPISINIDDSDRVSDETVASDTSINVATTDQPMVKLEPDALKSSVGLDESSALVINLQFDGDMADRKLPADDAAVTTRCDVIANSATKPFDDVANVVEESEEVFDEIIAPTGPINVATKNPDVTAPAQCGSTTSSPAIPFDDIAIDIGYLDRVSDETVASDKSINVATTDQPMIKLEPGVLKSSVGGDESSALIINRKPDDDMADKEFPADDVTDQVVIAVDDAEGVSYEIVTPNKPHSMATTGQPMMNPDALKSSTGLDGVSIYEMQQQPSSHIAGKHPAVPVKTAAYDKSIKNAAKTDEPMIKVDSRVLEFPVGLEDSSAYVINRQPTRDSSDEKHPSEDVAGTAQTGFAINSATITYESTATAVDNSDELPERGFSSDNRINVVGTDDLVKIDPVSFQSLDELIAYVVEQQSDRDVANKEHLVLYDAVSRTDHVHIAGAVVSLSGAVTKIPTDCPEAGSNTQNDRTPSSIHNSQEDSNPQAKAFTDNTIAPVAFEIPSDFSETEAYIIARQPADTFLDYEVSVPFVDDLISKTGIRRLDAHSETVTDAHITLLGQISDTDSLPVKVQSLLTVDDNQSVPNPLQERIGHGNVVAVFEGIASKTNLAVVEKSEIPVVSSELSAYVAKQQLDSDVSGREHLAVEDVAATARNGWTSNSATTAIDGSDEGTPIQRPNVASNKSEQKDSIPVNDMQCDQNVNLFIAVPEESVSESSRIDPNACDPGTSGHVNEHQLVEDGANAQTTFVVVVPPDLSDHVAGQSDVTSNSPSALCDRTPFDGCNDSDLTVEHHPSNADEGSLLYRTHTLPGSNQPIDHDTNIDLETVLDISAKRTNEIIGKTVHIPPAGFGEESTGTIKQQIAKSDAEIEDYIVFPTSLDRISHETAIQSQPNPTDVVDSIAVVSEETDPTDSGPVAGPRDYISAKESGKAQSNDADQVEVISKDESGPGDNVMHNIALKCPAVMYDNVGLKAAKKRIFIGGAIVLPKPSISK